MRKKIVWILTGVLSVIGVKAQIDTDALQAVSNLYENLKLVEQEKEFFFGQEFFNSFQFNVGVQDDPSFSDCKDVTGEHPGVLGQDFHYYLYKSDNERKAHKDAALYAFSEGAVITFDFHIRSRVAQSTYYTDDDKYLMYNIGNQDDTYGDLTWYNGVLDDVLDIINKDLSIPIVFRLFHEMNGNWFWWGSEAYGGTEAYIKLYRYTVNYLKQRTNLLLFAWSPDKGLHEQYYPGNDYVDIVGLDGYDMDEVNYYSSADMVSDLTDLVSFAAEHNKVAIFSETGNRESSPDSNSEWWINSVYTPIMESNSAWKIAWILTWINSNWADHPYIPYSGSNTEAKNAFTAFKNLKETLFLPETKEKKMYERPASSTLKLYTSDKEGLQIYPNPASGNEEIHMNTSNVIDALTITDLTGRTIRSYGQIVPGIVNLNLSGITSGTYWVRITYAADYSTGTLLLVQ